MNATQNRLVHALLAMWATAPAEAISVRGVTQAAGTAGSAVHYHFDNFERLYLAASDAALAAAQDWMAARLDELALLGAAPVPPGLQASIIATTIADWTDQHRDLAMALRRAPGRAWFAAWEGFWHRLAQRLGLEHVAPTLALFAAGKSARHLLVWHPVVERALLEETVAALLMWLGQRQFGSDAVRLHHRALALSGYDRPAAPGDAQGDRIAEAAADLLQHEGHGGLTFRAVARRAGVTLGSVIHHCGTKSELLRGALHRLYVREAMGGGIEVLAASTFAPAAMRDLLLGSVLGGDQPVLRAYDEIELATYNGAEFKGLRGVVRSMEDPSASWALQQMLGGSLPPCSLAAAFSDVIRGIGFAAEHAGKPASTMTDWAEQALRPFVLAP